MKKIISSILLSILIGLSANAQTFTKQTGISLTAVAYQMNHAANWIDYNNDGLLDIFISGGTTTSGCPGFSGIYTNAGNNTFTTLTGLPFSSFAANNAEWSDFNNDGFVDLIISAESTTNTCGNSTKIFNNNGNGTFSEILNLAVVGKIEIGDYNNDGKLDFALFAGDNPASVRIYKNNGNETFTWDTSITFPTVIHSSVVSFVDYDKDGFLDLFIGGNDASYKGQCYLYKNNGDNTFSQVTTFATNNQEIWSITWSDFNNDGYLDFFKGDSAVYTNNSGNGTFTRNNIAMRRIGGCNEWGDYNNDGKPDILIGGGIWPEDLNVTRVYKNNGSLSFTDIGGTITGTAQWSSLKWGDYDNDGYLDFLVTGYTKNSPWKCAEVYKSSGGTIQNTVPTAPSNLSVSSANGITTLTWNAASDNQTNANALTYNVRIGTTPGGSEIVNALSNKATGFRRLVGNGNSGTNLKYIIKGLAIGTYYWSVQAIDQAYAGGSFATEASFTLPLSNQSTINNGLVAWYPFNSNANDASGNGNNGTVNGSALTTDRFGNANSAYSFNGTNNFIEIPNSSSLDLSTNIYSISFWMKSTYPTTKQCQFITKYSGIGTTTNGLMFVLNNSTNGNSLQYMYQSTAGGWGSAQTPVANLPQSGSWVHVLITTNNGYDKLYVNGLLVSSNTTKHSYKYGANTNSLRLGVGPTQNTGNYFNGSLDDIRIYNRELSQSESNTLYNETQTGDITTGLVAYYPFNGSGNDASGNGNNGTVYGATLTTDRFGNANSAFGFNGTSNYIQVADANSLDFGNTTSFTISCWIKTTGTDGNFHGIVTKSTITPTTELGWQLGSQNNVIQNEFGGGTTVANFHGNILINNNNWHLITYIVNRNTNNASYYVDGILDNSLNSSNFSLNISNSRPMYFGADRQLGAPYFFQGSIDDIRIYNRVLSQSEVTALYNENSQNVTDCKFTTNSESWVGTTDITNASNILDNDQNTFGHIAMSNYSTTYTKSALINFPTAKSISGFKFKYSFPATVQSNCHGYPDAIAHSCKIKLYYKDGDNWVDAYTTNSDLNTTADPSICEVVDSAKFEFNTIIAQEWKIEMIGCYWLGGGYQTTTYFKLFEANFKECASIWTDIVSTKYSSIIKTYPNPTNDAITIDINSDFNLQKDYRLKIMNILGQSVYESLVTKHISTINLNSWTSKGIYVIQLIDGSSNVIDNKKIVLQ